MPLREIAIDTDTFALIWSCRQTGEDDENAILTRIIKEYQLYNINADGPQNGVEELELKTSCKTSNALMDSTLRPHSEIKPENAQMHAHPIGKVRWVDDIRAAIHSLGGEAHLQEIYKTVEQVRRSAGRSTPKTTNAIIRRTLEDHCESSANFRGVCEFEHMLGHGSGVWALEKPKR